MTHALLVRTTEDGCRQRWSLKMSYFSRNMAKYSKRTSNFSNKTWSSERRLLKSTGNRESYRR